MATDEAEEKVGAGATVADGKRGQGRCIMIDLLRQNRKGSSHDHVEKFGIQKFAFA